MTNYSLSIFIILLLTGTMITRVSLSALRSGCPLLRQLSLDSCRRVERGERQREARKAAAVRRGEGGEEWVVVGE